MSESTTITVVHLYPIPLTFVDLPGNPDASSSVGNSKGELINPCSLMETSQTTLVVFTLEVDNSQMK